MRHAAHAIRADHAPPVKPSSKGRPDATSDACLGYDTALY